MKKIYLLLIAIALMFTGCDLDKFPETNYSDAAFWKTETDVRAACNRLYEQLRGFTHMSGVYHDMRSDELIGKNPNSTSDGSRAVPGTSGNDWNDPYDRIFTANNIITKAASANVEEDILNRYIAEAYFFRAYNHFLLVRLYGDVPLMQKAIEDPEDSDIYQGRNPREEVIQQCYEDLEYAAKWLPTRAAITDKDWGRVMRSSALGMIVRIGLYEGTYSKYHNLGSDYKAHLRKAIDAMELLMKEGHDLYPDFQKLFYFDGEGKQNKENVFVKVYGPNGNGTTVHGHARALENGAAVSRQIIDMFLYEDGLPASKTSKKIANEKSYQDVLENRDPRLKMSIYSLGETAYKGGYIPFTNEHGNGYPIKKGFVLSEWTTTGKETIDNMIIRYAEMLIAYAEALYEYNGSITDTQLDQTINKVRARAGFNVKLTNAFVTTNGLNMLEEIRRERAVELLDENVRYDDIIRWKIAEKVLPVAMVGVKFVDSETSKARKDLENRLTDASGKLDGVQVIDQADMYVLEVGTNRKFDPAKDYLYPIPTNEIALSKDNIKQNPKW